MNQVIRTQNPEHITQNSFIIILIHRVLYAGKAETFYDFTGFFAPVGQERGFFIRPVTQHVMHLSATRKVIPDTESKSVIIAVTQYFLYIFKSVVTGI